MSLRKLNELATLSQKKLKTKAEKSKFLETEETQRPMRLESNRGSYKQIEIPQMKCSKIECINQYN